MGRRVVPATATAESSSPAVGAWRMTNSHQHLVGGQLIYARRYAWLTRAVLPAFKPYTLLPSSTGMNASWRSEAPTGLAPRRQGGSRSWASTIDIGAELAVRCPTQPMAAAIPPPCGGGGRQRWVDEMTRS
jgi:hypothetical protein